MGYAEKVLSDNEQIVYRARQHVAVLVRQAGAMFFAFVVFLAIGLAILIPEPGETGNEIRFWVGVVALGSLILPAIVIIRMVVAQVRGRDLATRAWRPAATIVLILVAALFLMFKPDFRALGWVAIVVALVPLALVIQSVLRWGAKQYFITTYRVVEVEGITDKHIRDSALEKVNDVELDQSLLGRMLGYGHVRIITGSDIGVDELYMLRKPMQFKRAMLNAKHDLEVQAPTAGWSVPEKNQTEVQQSKITELIAELATLHKAGVLSDEEFETKKKDLLSRL
ncbi:MAG: PH domain-containing protein [Anaerolineae bacterium]|nr:PH domain-containing protein [Anaerolineae bacterium]